jgi:hypothetical protein
LEETECLSPSVLSPGDSNKDDTPFVTPGQALNLGEEDRRAIGWQSPPSATSDTSEELRAREKRSKSNQDRPSRILAKELATQLQFEPAEERKEDTSLLWAFI